MPTPFTRRQFVRAATVTGLAAGAPAFAAAAPTLPARVTPLPLTDVRLLPSEFATAVAVNQRYLLRLSADRLLHNFLLYAGLSPRAAIYGGWESDTIAGHTLGHYLSALCLTYQQTGDTACRDRTTYIVAELARAQQARGTGYVGALGRKGKDGKIVDGEVIFTEIKHGDIRSGGFDLNGSWSPLYTVHKLFAGLLDTHAACNNAQALQVLTGLATYFATVFDALNEDQMQRVLACEYGGLNESFAELYSRTGNRRWLLISERLYDHRVLDPLEAQQDKLANFHANTQVPKLIGLERIHELTGDPARGTAAHFFWTAVVNHHSYVIGGNADREYFSEPDTIADHISEQTCEHCNTYNMLKLTRMLYSEQPDGSFFDYYDRAHLNHVMAQQDPATGGFTYMTPLMTGAERGFSTAEDDAFWCCVGTGMESHAKHGDSIFWQGDNTLLVNLYIPSEATWDRHKAHLRLDTNYPNTGSATLTLTALHRRPTFTVALRIPGWVANPSAARLTVNGSPVQPTLQRGYALVTRRWRQGDVLALDLPLDLRLEPTPGNPSLVTVVRGPMVLAADLGPVATPWNSPDPALVGETVLAAFHPTASNAATYTTTGIVRPADLTFVPFFRQYNRRSAVYFQHFTEAGWNAEEASYLAEQTRQRDILARSVDVMHLGEMQPERDHNLTSENSYPLSYRGRNGRDARSGGYFEFTLKCSKTGPLVLQTTYWGAERGQNFDILVDNVKVARQELHNNKPGKFFEVEYPIPQALTQNKQSIRVRFVPHDQSTAGPVFGVTLFTAKSSHSRCGRVASLAQTRSLGPVPVSVYRTSRTVAPAAPSGTVVAPASTL